MGAEKNVRFPFRGRIKLSSWANARIPTVSQGFEPKVLRRERELNKRFKVPTFGFLRGLN